MSEKLTKKEVREMVQENEDSITRIISPSDLIHQDISNWENADMTMLKDELHDSLSEWHFMATHPYEDLIQELAVSLYMDEMVRIPFDHLVFESRDKAVIEGYWLYDMDNREIMDRIHENKEDMEFFHEYEQNAQMFIESCVIDTQVQELE